MDKKTIFTATHYDPEGKLFGPLLEALPWLQSCFSAITITVDKHTDTATRELLANAGCFVKTREDMEECYNMPPIGNYRRQALAHALEHNPSCIFFSDLDRAVHWANFYPDELRKSVEQADMYDCLVFGRTDRAFCSHPLSMTRTESIVNTLFRTISCLDWDVVAAARGFSAVAADFLVRHSRDETFGCDVSWPLLLKQAGIFSLGYEQTEGLEYETADVCAEEIRAMGLDNWKLEMDSLSHWLYRLKAVQIEIDSMLPFSREQATVDNTK